MTEPSDDTMRERERIREKLRRWARRYLDQARLPGFEASALIGGALDDFADHLDHEDLAPEVRAGMGEQR